MSELKKRKPKAVFVLGRLKRDWQICLVTQKTNSSAFSVPNSTIMKYLSSVGVALGIVLVILLNFSPLQAQLPTYSTDSAFLDANDLKMAINSGSDLSWDLVGNPRFEVPQGSGTHALFAGNLWIGGLDGSGQLRMAAQSYRQSGNDLFPGPVADTYDSAQLARYSRVWKVSKAEVLTHQSMAGQAGYSAPADIQEWPGNGDTTNGEPFFLAPFVDQNQNMVYEPDLGDHPAFPGDQALYMINNDLAAPHTESGGEALGIDIHLMAYVYDTLPGSALDQTVFLSYRIVNRGNQNLSEVRAGLWLDFDLGFFNDDYVGCDTLTESFFVYNADNQDGIPGGYGFGATPPALGASILNQSMSHFRLFQSNFTVTGFPVVPADYYSYLTNLWKDGTPLTLGGDGYQGSIPIDYAYPGDVSDSSQWSEVSENNPIGDRRGVGSVGPFSLMPGEVYCMDVALVFGRADSGDHLSSVPILLDRIRTVRKFYEGAIHACDLYQTETVSISAQEEMLPIRLYPNPTQDRIFMDLEVPNGSLQILDVHGKQMLSESWTASQQHSWEISEWPAGLYFVHVQTEKQFYFGKFVKNWTRQAVKSFIVRKVLLANFRLESTFFDFFFSFHTFYIPNPSKAALFVKQGVTLFRKTFLRIGGSLEWSK